MRFVGQSTPRHTIIFDSFKDNGMLGYEATTEFNHDKVVYEFRAFNTILDYIPRRYNNVCNKTRLPLIHNMDQMMKASNSPANPYPAPDSSLTGTPYP